MLAATDLHSYYGDSHVLQGVSLAVGRGEVVAILGRNGMGKTTLIRGLIGFTPPRQGRVLFKGKDVTNLPPFRAVEMGMGLVPQGRRIFPSLSVLENLKVAACSDGEQRWTLERVFALFPRLAARKAHLGDKLSGGEQQMLAIGRALMTNPDLLLMDEPTEGLAPLVVREVASTLDQLRREGLSILLVEQSVPFATRVADKVHVLSRGLIVHSCSPAELLANDEVKSRYLGLG
ncbi:MAG TPA: ABC transporter ATP-binding protein [Myxococcales bacterium]|nr:ABC transporter ATP-binding protein [Myxococcales bacterium]